MAAVTWPHELYLAHAGLISLALSSLTHPASSEEGRNGRRCSCWLVPMSRGTNGRCCDSITTARIACISRRPLQAGALAGGTEGGIAEQAGQTLATAVSAQANRDRRWPSRPLHDDATSRAPRVLGGQDGLLGRQPVVSLPTGGSDAAMDCRRQADATRACHLRRRHPRRDPAAGVGH